jgi:hypothetical protein
MGSVRNGKAVIGAFFDRTYRFSGSFVYHPENYLTDMHGIEIVFHVFVSRSTYQEFSISSKVC